MNDATMLFRAGDTAAFVPGGRKFDYIVVEASEVEAKLKEGWYAHFTGVPEPEAQTSEKSEAQTSEKSEAQTSEKSETQTRSGNARSQARAY